MARRRPGRAAAARTRRHGRRPPRPLRPPGRPRPRSPLLHRPLHLRPGRFGGPLRAGRRARRFVARRRGDTPFPPVVTGDLNAWPDSDEVRLLGGYKTVPAVPGQVLLDAWEYADPAAPSATWDAANPYVARTWEPSVRIDYIHVGPPGPGGLGHVRAVRRACDGPVDGVWPSDHAAVVADLADPA